MITIDNLKYLLRQQAELTKKIYPHPDWKYNSFEDLFLDCGTEFITYSTSNIELYWSQGCYQNCQQLVREYPELIYCEGYALAPDVVIPIRHAWLIDLSGKIIEPTWNEHDSVYLGIPFSTSWFQSVLDKRSARGREDEISIFEGNYLEKFSLLSEGLPEEAIAKTMTTAQD